MGEGGEVIKVHDGGRVCRRMGNHRRDKMAGGKAIFE